MVITEQEIKTNEKLIGLNILLVIYLHDKRYTEAMEDIEELLNDPEMRIYKEYLLLKQAQIRRAFYEPVKCRYGLIDGIKDVCRKLFNEMKPII